MKKSLIFPWLCFMVLRGCTCDGGCLCRVPHWVYGFSPPDGFEPLWEGCPYHESPFSRYQWASQFGRSPEGSEEKTGDVFRDFEMVKYYIQGYTCYLHILNLVTITEIQLKMNRSELPVFLAFLCVEAMGVAYMWGILSVGVVFGIWSINRFRLL